MVFARQFAYAQASCVSAYHRICLKIVEPTMDERRHVHSPAIGWVGDAQEGSIANPHGFFVSICFVLFCSLALSNRGNVQRWFASFPSGTFCRGLDDTKLTQEIWALAIIQLATMSGTPSTFNPAFLRLTRVFKLLAPDRETKMQKRPGRRN